MHQHEQMKHITCRKCNFATVHKKSLRRHVNLVHGNEAENAKQCDLCDFVTVYSDSMRRHKDKKHGIMILKCDKCDFTSRRSDWMNTHKLFHENQAKAPEVSYNKNDMSTGSGNLENGEAWYNGTEYKCNFCPLSRAEKFVLVQHVDKYHKNKAWTDPGFTIVREDYYKCKLCSRTVNQSLAFIKLHLKRCHDISIAEYQIKYEKQPLAVFDPSLPPPKDVMWYDRCAWQCNSCVFWCWNEDLFKQHAGICVQENGNGQNVSKKKVVTNSYCCKICGYVVEHTYRRIHYHLKKSHSLSLPKYTKMYESENPKSLTYDKPKDE